MTVAVGHPAVVDDVRAAFSLVNENGDGTMDHEDVRRILYILDAERWTDARVAKLLEASDASCGGRVRLGEFLDWLFAHVKDPRPLSSSPSNSQVVDVPSAADDPATSLVQHLAFDDVARPFAHQMEVSGVWMCEGDHGDFLAVLRQDPSTGEVTGEAILPENGRPPVPVVGRVESQAVSSKGTHGPKVLVYSAPFATRGSTRFACRPGEDGDERLLAGMWDHGCGACGMQRMRRGPKLAYAADPCDLSGKWCWINPGHGEGVFRVIVEQTDSGHVTGRVTIAGRTCFEFDGQVDSGWLALTLYLGDSPKRCLAQVSPDGLSLAVPQEGPDTQREWCVAMFGLQGAGKTTALSRFALQGDALPADGPQEAMLYHKGVRMRVRDVGAHDALRVQHWTSLSNVAGLIFIVDCWDTARLVDARDELVKVLDDDAFRNAALLVLLNKIDLPSSLSCVEVVETLGLPELQARQWHAQAMCAAKGDGLAEAIDWLSSVVAWESGISSLRWLRVADADTWGAERPTIDVNGTWNAAGGSGGVLITLRQNPETGDVCGDLVHPPAPSITIVGQVRGDVLMYLLDDGGDVTTFSVSFAEAGGDMLVGRWEDWDGNSGGHMMRRAPMLADAGDPADITGRWCWPASGGETFIVELRHAFTGHVSGELYAGPEAESQGTLDGRVDGDKLVCTLFTARESALEATISPDGLCIEGATELGCGGSVRWLRASFQ
mmetsp:Transcript_112991/g.319612  ORF Transcript_112991/g.319612 Transcript_112991/m.319612 type:complete len:721 (+) Transcript_112991:129-2291(+)